MIRSKKILFFIAAMIVSLIAIGYLEADLILLKSDKYSVKIGTVTLSIHSLLQTIITVALLISGTIYTSRLIESRINELRTKASTKGLLVKSSYVLLYFIAFLMTLKVIGIDLTTLTVFVGAVSVGIGLGLQRIASNFIAGLVLLFEKSFEVGDLLELNDGTSGIVKNTGARYTLIETFSGKEIIVPNEELFINKVINWTHSTNKARTEISIKVPYKYDIDQMKALIENTALASQHCTKDPKPSCIVKDVSEGVITFGLLFWIENATKGFSLQESEMRLEVWRALKKNGVEIHLPQRELRITHVNNAQQV